VTGGVRVEGVGKRYKRYPRPAERLVEWLTLGRVARHEPLWVLRGVSFEVEPGTAIGVVGANGSGKSTLLKIIKGTIRPSEGRVELAGRIAALELGLGFHADFTGRENLYLGGALLGLRAGEVEELLPEIEAFAEIGRAIDDPVRTYSAGMQLRLAFSLATALRPDVLLIDEALAVGDVYFQQKCVARIRRFRDQGTALLLVSHDPVAVKTFCDRAVLLDRGLLAREGPPDRVLEYYNAMIAKQTADQEIFQAENLGKSRGQTRSGDRRATIEIAELRDDSGPARAFRVGETVGLRIEGRVRLPVEDLTVGFAIRDRLGNDVFGTNTHHLVVAAPPLRAGERFRAEFRFPLNLGPGNYSVTTALHAGPVHLGGSYDWWDNVCVFQVIPGDEPYFVGTCHLPVESRLEAVAGDASPVVSGAAHR